MVFGPQLYALIKCMNYFSVLKFIIPTLNYKLIVHNEHAPVLPTALPLPPTLLDFERHHTPLPKPVLPGILPTTLEEDSEEKAVDEEETCKSTCSFPQSDQLQRNLIDNRVKHTQY